MGEGNKCKVYDNKGTNFCFTDFKEDNITNGYNKIYEDYKDIIRGIAWGIEVCPKTGKKHNQGYIQVFQQCRFTAIQKIFKSKCHFEVMNGSIKDNENYCSKDNIYTSLGYFCTQGYKSDAHNIKEDLKSGASMYDIMNNYTGTYLRYHNGIEKMKQLISSKKFNFDVDKCKVTKRKITTTALIGEAGSGKSTYVVDKYGMENVFFVNLSGDGNLFDGYEGQDIILLDDFNGNIKYTEMLRILDENAYRANIKYGYTYANWTKVYITSNVKPIYWYKKIRDNFKRRIKICLEVSKGNTKIFTHSNDLEYKFNGYNTINTLNEPWEKDDDYKDEYDDDKDEW